MLLPYTTLEYFGPGAGAVVVPGQAAADAAIRATARAGAVQPASGVVAKAKATRLRNRPAIVACLAAMALALPKARARAALAVKIGNLSQDDVTGAVMESRVEGTITLKQALRLLLAHAAGNATGLDGASIAFKSVDGATTRIAGTLSGGTRTITTRDAE